MRLAADNLRLAADESCNLGDDGVQLNGLVAAQVDDFKTGRLNRGDGATCDVLDISEVALLRAVAEDRDRQAFRDAVDETEDAHVGAAGRPVDGEVAEHRHVEMVQMMIGVGDCFGGFLRCGVG